MNNTFELDIEPKQKFRAWLNQRWLEHKDEVLTVTGRVCDYDLGVYFNKYKWWLKRVYKETQRGQ